jgi:hypothetical protein
MRNLPDETNQKTCTVGSAGQARVRRSPQTGALEALAALPGGVPRRRGLHVWADRRTLSRLDRGVVACCSR